MVSRDCPGLVSLKDGSELIAGIGGGRNWTLKEHIEICLKENEVRGVSQEVMKQILEGVLLTKSIPKMVM